MEQTTQTSAQETDATLYAKMALIRQFEQAAYRAYEQGDILGSIHSSIGQEALAVGVIDALEPGDKVLSHHRGHGHALAKGVDPNRLMAELFGKADGLCRGKGGSMHITDLSCGFLGSLAVVGSSIPLAVGAALAMRKAEAPHVCVVFFGDGGINQGVLYESMNLAAIWRLPVVFVCENNGFAISVRSSTATGGDGLVARAKAFGLAAATSVDGQDVLAVREAAASIVDTARYEGPALIEGHTYRFMGHSRGDPPHGLYRSEDEVSSAQERDPLELHAARAGISEQERHDLDRNARERITEALAFARASSPPSPDAAMEDVWG